MDVLWICVLLMSLQTSVSHAINNSLDHKKAPKISRISPTGCGIRQESDTKVWNDFDPGYRITGGKPSTIPWPWMAALFSNKAKNPFLPLCGGVLIDDRHILTAAHCVQLFSSNPEVFTVIVGEISPHKKLTKVPVEAVKVHEDYVNPYAYNDIAILRLRYPLRDAIPICLPEEISLNAGDNCTLLGWGDLYYGGSRSLTLQEVSGLPIVSNEECYFKYKQVPRISKISFPKGMNNTFICAGLDEGGKDACQNDSGGPLLYEDPTSKTWYSVGVVTFGYKCGEPGIPGVYTRVTQFTKWIEDYVDSYKTYQ